MSPYDVRACLEYLVPGAVFDEAGNDYASVVWKDARSQPTDAQCAAAWPDVQAQAATAAQAAATASANESTIGSKVDAALAVNDAFLALASPTNAQTLAQVKALTRECSGLIRLLRHKLDSTSGT